MSICRWSSDGWKSDVYVYESDRGIETHVAANRYVWADDHPHPGPAPDLTACNIDEWMDWHHLERDALDHATLEPIGGAYDGESYLDVTSAGCHDRLLVIRSRGYHVPQGAIDALGGVS